MIASGSDLFLDVSGNGRLDFSGRETDQYGCRVYATNEGVSWGSVEQVVADLAALPYGSVEVGRETPNREIALQLCIEGPDLGAVSASEGRLQRWAGGRGSLGWASHRGAEVTVFDVLWWKLDHAFEVHEATTNRRLFTLTLRTLPHPRAAEETFTPVMTAPEPPAAPPTPIQINDCTSTTGWAGTPLPLQTASGYVYSGWTVVGPYDSWGGPNQWRNRLVDMTLTQGGMDFTSTRYLVVEWQIRRPGGGRQFTTPVVSVGSSTARRSPVYERYLADDWVQSVYDLAGVGVTPRLGFHTTKEHPVHKHRLLIRDVSRVATIPASDETGHQMVRTITVDGSAPTEASLHMWTDGDFLGETLVHTSAAERGMLSLDPFLTTDSTPATGTVSGSLKPLDSTVSYDIPAGMFNPERSTTRELLVRVTGATNPTLTGRVQSLMGSAVSVNPVVPTLTQATTHTLDGAVTRILSLGLFTVPPRLVDGEYAAVRVQVDLGEHTPAGTPSLDDAWLVDVETGELTWLHNNFGQLFRHMWIESPTRDYPLPRVRVATTEDLAWGVEADTKAMGRHEWAPGDVYVTTVSTLATGTHLQGSYFKRGRSSIARGET